jgi:oligopeptide/dipeptide ABC transporter ATP-binding protein
VEELLRIRDLEVSFQRGRLSPETQPGLGRQGPSAPAQENSGKQPGLPLQGPSPAAAGVARALRGIDLALAPGEVHGLVGESGSGKTVTATCVLGLLPMPPARINRGQILFEDRDLLAVSETERRRLRGRKMAMIFQEPGKYLNPALRNGEQIVEMLMLHLGLERPEADRRALELLARVGLPGGRRVLRGYPHELSGGMKQRLMIAMAVSCSPQLLIADEPTTALDVTLQKQILRLLLALRESTGMAVLFISHDLRIVREISGRISVIYAGRIVESAVTSELFERPLHPYTRLLLASIPDAAKRGTPLRVIPGGVPDAEHVPAGCAFHPRCPLAEEMCGEVLPGKREYGNGAGPHTAECHLIGKKWPDS